MSDFGRPGKENFYGNSSDRSRRQVVDKLGRDRCRECGRPVQFDTDGFGRLIAREIKSLRRHPCRSP